MLHKASPSVASGRLEADSLCVPLPPCRDEPDAILRLNDNTFHWTLAGGMGGISELKRSGDPGRLAGSPITAPRSAPPLLNVTAKVRRDFIFSSSFMTTPSHSGYILNLSRPISLSISLFLSTYICIYTSSRFYTPRPSFFTPFHTPDWRWRWIEDEACCRLPPHFASLPFLKATSSPHFSRLSFFRPAFISLSNTAGRLPFSFYFQEPGFVGASDSCLKSQPAEEKCLQAHYSAKKGKISQGFSFSSWFKQYSFPLIGFSCYYFQGEKNRKTVRVQI